VHVVLTGSSGWLRRCLAPQLRSRGHRVSGIDVAPGADTDVLGSVHDRAAVERVFALAGRVDAVVHSLMISQALRDAASGQAVWLDEASGPLAPRNIYGATKLAAEALCRAHHLVTGLPCVVLRTSRFFPEDDDAHDAPAGENLKANELLYRRLTVEDAARAHLLALEQAPRIGFDVLIVSAPCPFTRDDAAALGHDAAALVAARFPDAPALYAARGWTLPRRIDRVYDASRAERVLGFRAQTDFAAMLAALRSGAPLPFAHDPGYVGPAVAVRAF
jgi:nucleoside-diphosphate-sugar epimerase